MKRLISLVVTGGLVLSLCACDMSDTNDTTELTEETKIVETTESKFSLAETSETTVLEETTTTSESETEIETETESETESEPERVAQERGSVFIDCSGKSAEEIVNNVEAIRTIGFNVTHESFADKFAVRPDFYYEPGNTHTIYSWYSEDLESNVFIPQVLLVSNVDSGDDIVVDAAGRVDIMIMFDDLKVAKAVYEEVKNTIFDEYRATLTEEDEEYVNDDRDDRVWTATCGVPRYVSLDTKANDEGLYQLDISIDLK